MARNLFDTLTAKGALIAGTASLLASITPYVVSIVQRHVSENYKADIADIGAIAQLVFGVGGLGGAGVALQGRMRATEDVYTPDWLPGRSKYKAEILSGEVGFSGLENHHNWVIESELKEAGLVPYPPGQNEQYIKVEDLDKIDGNGGTFAVTDAEIESALKMESNPFKPRSGTHSGAYVVNLKPSEGDRFKIDLKPDPSPDSQQNNGS